MFSVVPLRKFKLHPLQLERYVVRPPHILAITNQEALTSPQRTSYILWFAHAEAHAQ